MNKLARFVVLQVGVAAVAVSAGCAETPPESNTNTQTASSAPVHMQCQTDNQTGSLVQRNSICVPDDVTGDVQRNTQETFRNFNHTP
jgi:hypothetical protein